MKTENCRGQGTTWTCPVVRRGSAGVLPKTSVMGTTVSPTWPTHDCPTTSCRAGFPLSGLPGNMTVRVQLLLTGPGVETSRVLDDSEGLGPEQTCAGGGGGADYFCILKSFCECAPQKKPVGFHAQRAFGDAPHGGPVGTPLCPPASCGHSTGCSENAAVCPALVQSDRKLYQIKFYFPH